ncbi:MAG: putative ATP-dependent RNA helicase DHR1 [Sclerophora amabilis]|nr:MAG: putative ATP-dependent RNA helicase DHR1 [Sclerophora amabilis]
MQKFVPRERKHRKLQRAKDGDGKYVQDDVSSSVVEILPASKEVKEEKRRKLKNELRAQQPRASSKKQKRLDKYIDNKLKKEENLDLIKRLAQGKVDTSLLRSSRNLGVTKESKRDVLSRALKERQSGINIEGNDEILLQEREIQEVNTTPDPEAFNHKEHSPTTNNEHVKISQSVAPSMVGSGLKRPLEVGGNGFPVLKKRKGTKASILKSSTIEDPPWEGFDSCSEIIGSAGSLSPSENGSDSLSEGDASQISSDSAPEEDEDKYSSESDSGTGDEEDNSKATKRERASAFKAWATQRMHEAIGHQPFYESSVLDISAVNFTPRAPEQDPLPAELKTTKSTRKAFSVKVNRTPEVEASRLALPVVAEEQKIMEAIHNNPVVVIWGATGSGKTTQIPQFLYEAGYGDAASSTPGMIGVTQPRRVAAVSMARRVGEEMGLDAPKVAYKVSPTLVITENGLTLPQIRFEGTVNDNTTIKFMTDGILLREASEHITLRKYSVVVIDEAHERSKDTDILIGMMSRIVKLREELSREDSSTTPLKLIIMSATLKISDFTDNRLLFDQPPPLIQAEGRQHPVTMHWTRRTVSDYVDAACHKITKGHRRLPPGGMLVFLTGQSEIVDLSKRLDAAFPTRSSEGGSSAPKVRISGQEAPLEAEDMDLGSLRMKEEDDLDWKIDSGSDIIGLEHDSEDDEEFNIEESQESVDSDAPLLVLPLYSLLPTKEQLRVFKDPPEGCRLVVLATNIAETSLTIPGIRYVIDCGRSKERKYDDATGVQSFEVGWISKASASQRAGRAGRTGPGHCYRLYSSAVYERDFEEYPQPEILRTPIEGVVLQLSGLNVPNIINKFPFPTQPERNRLDKAQKLLTYLGAVSSTDGVTNFGRKMANYPLFPRFAKILLTGHRFSCLPHVVAIVAALSVPQIFIPENYLNMSSLMDSKKDSNGKYFSNADRLEADAQESRLKSYNRSQHQFSQLDGTSDALKLLSAVSAHAAALNPNTFCVENFLRPNAMREVQLLRRQLTNLIRGDQEFSGVIGIFQPCLPKLSDKQISYLKQVVASGYIDQVAIRGDLAPTPTDQFRKPKRATDVPYLTLFPSQLHKEDHAAVYIHPSSVLAFRSPQKLPQYIIYSHLQHSAGSSKIRMHPLTSVTGAQLAALAKDTPLLSYSKPIKQVTVKELENGKREVWVVPTMRGPPGGQGWPLPAEKMVQQRIKGVWTQKT